ncbi:MAG: cation transporter [Lachnospiraceae bacterium]|nr:cation transporter [Lachnospiraceae bacterium]
MPTVKKDSVVESREKIIVRTSIIGIIANALLAGFKAFVGIVTGSIAIILDAVNNLSDALSSVITIIGTKIANKGQDKEHPLGHGRVEYLTAMIIAVIVLYAGITSLKESVVKIIHPERPEYTTASLIIVGVAIFVKIGLGLYVKRTGESVKSESLTNSGADALNDSIISASTLFAAIVFIVTGLSLEAYLGVIISIIIIKAGVEMLQSAYDQIVGVRIDAEMASGIRKTVSSVDGVYGVYDLLLHNYGPEFVLGSVHIEVPDTMTADEIDKIEREIQEKVLRENNVIMTSVGIYSRNTTNSRAANVRAKIIKMLREHDYILQMHGFYFNEEEKRIQFDVIIDFDAPDRIALYNHIVQEVQEAYPDYTVNVALDVDLTD